MKKYTVAEFAEILGISKQAVYKRIQTKKMKPFVIYEKGKTYIEETAISIIKKVEQPSLIIEQPKVEKVSSEKVETAENEGKTEVEQPSEKDEQPKVETFESPSFSALIDQLEKKDQQIDFLQKQIQDLQETMKEKDNYIIDQGKQLARLLEQANTLKYLESADQNQEPQQPPEDPGSGTETKVKSKRPGFFARIFKKPS